MKNGIDTVALIGGAGFMGKQIAARAASFGTRVHVYDANTASLEGAKAEIDLLIDIYHLAALVTGDHMKARDRVVMFEEAGEAIESVDMLLEIVPEQLDLKKKVFGELDRIAGREVIFASNSSSIPVSRIEDAVSRKDRMMNVHFYAPVDKNYFVDIMGGSGTSPETFDRVKTWVESIGCIPLVVKKECMGFVFNRVWHAIKRECLASWGNGNADFRDIDRAWMIWAGAKVGPFGMMDGVGLDVVYDIEMEYFKDSGDPRDEPPRALREMVERRDLGIKTGRGFYDYSDLEYVKPDFLKQGGKDGLT